MLTIKINGPQFDASSLLKMTDLFKVTGLVVAVLSSYGLSTLAQAQERQLLWGDTCTPLIRPTLSLMAT